MTVVNSHAASHVHASAAATHTSTPHRSAAVDQRARAWRSSLFRHALHAWHPTHALPHSHTAAAERLMHLFGNHAGAHPFGRHEGHGNRQQHTNQNGNPRHRQPGSQSGSQSDAHQKHKQQSQQQPRHAKAPAQPPRHAQRPARHPMHGNWSTRRDANGAAPGSNASPLRLAGDGSNSNGGQRDAPRDESRRAAAAVRRVAAVVRTELQVLAARTADQPFVYTGAMREAVIRQRCAGHDPFAVSIDVVNARQLANDDTSSSYHDLQSFLDDFKRFSAGTGARGALTPLLAFHDLRPSTASLRTRSLSQLAALTTVARGR